MSSIAVPAPRTTNWVGARLAAAVFIVLAIALLAFSVGRVTADDSGSSPLPQFVTQSGTQWGADMCAHGVPCR
jgi:hypothetical protein